MKKHIFITYYCQRNFGDDLFIKLFCEHFSKGVHISIFGDPRYVPKHLGGHVSIAPYAYVTTVLGKLRSMTSGPRLAGMIDNWDRRLTTLAKRGKDADVLIGGSLFMDTASSQPRRDFSVPGYVKRDYSFNSQRNRQSNTFVIGANLGPVRSEHYFDRIRDRFRDTAHVCLRDYASYCQVRELPNVQYAPDVVFRFTPPPQKCFENHLVISVVDAARHTREQQCIQGYYRLLRELIQVYDTKGYKITLVSLCAREGDERATQLVLRDHPCADRVCTHTYQGNIMQTAQLFADATHVVASRFHSMILALLCGKPVFPIAYNEKTTHYLQDLAFHDRWASLDDICTFRAEDVMLQLERGYVCDCTDHRTHSKNQFRMLERFLEEVE